MEVSHVFGIAVTAMLILVLVSDDHALQKVGLLLMTAWAVSNFVVNYMGFPRAPLFVPSLDAAITILIAMIGYRARSNVSLAVVCIYAIVGMVHVLALILRMQETYTYYAVLNVLFATQLLIVGGSGAWLAIRSCIPASGERARPHPSRLPHPG